MSPEHAPTPDKRDAALGALLGRLDALDYRFVTITPASHARVLARGDKGEAGDIADVLGWSLPFAPDALPRPVLDDLRAAKVLAPAGPLQRTTIRVSRVGGALFVHSAYPTSAADSVFLGPDSYRFADCIAAALAAEPLARASSILDVGTGAGVGAVSAARYCEDARVVATDINPQALRFAAINAAAAGVTLQAVECDGASGVADLFDLVLMNPPYIIDADSRAYRHGGGLYGAELPLRLATGALTRLATGGRLLVYTGSAIVGGEDGFRTALDNAVTAAGCTMDYREIDPDVFGEELSSPAYAAVDRIALVCAIIRKPAGS